ncbi:9214_t:CDS:1, partial [Diversispora eburnea]
FTNISHQLNIPVLTVHDTIKQYKKLGSPQPKKYSEKPKEFTEYNEQVYTL